MVWSIFILLSSSVAAPKYNVSLSNNTLPVNVLSPLIVCAVLKVTKSVGSTDNNWYGEGSLPSTKWIRGSKKNPSASPLES